MSAPKLIAYRDQSEKGRNRWRLAFESATGIENATPETEQESYVWFVDLHRAVDFGYRNFGIRPRKSKKAS